MSNKGNSTLTIADVAAKAGVNISTVSRALRNHPSIPAATCKRIQKIVEEMGYRPNPLVSALMAQLRGQKPPDYKATLAYLNTHDTRAGWRQFQTNLFFYEGAVARAQQLGYEIEEFWLSDPAIGQKRFQRILEARGIQGIIIANLPDEPLSLPFSLDHFSCVTVGARLLNPLLHCATNDHYASMRLALLESIKLGYQRPALLLRDSMDLKLERRFFSAFLGAQLELAPKNRLPILRWNPKGLTRERRLQPFRQLFKEQRPDVVLTMSREVLPVLEEDGFTCPKDFGYVNLDLREDESHISGIFQNNLHVASAAVDMVVAQLHRNEVGVPPFAKVVLIEGRWNAGHTTCRQTPAS
jgi:DNA-binding LacI/PurR family transcriptional regulator